MSEPIIVVGTGRSGTSTVAGMLVDLGVDMGSGFTSDPSNPAGFFEDSVIKGINRARLNGGSVIGWRGALELTAEYRGSRRGPWGWKDPKTSEFIEDVVALFPGARYIRCIRDRTETVDSYMRWYNMDEVAAARIIDRRSDNLDCHLPASALTVSIADLRKDRAIVKEGLRLVLGL